MDHSSSMRTTIDSKWPLTAYVIGSWRLSPQGEDLLKCTFNLLCVRIILWLLLILLELLDHFISRTRSTASSLCFQNLGPWSLGLYNQSGARTILGQRNLTHLDFRIFLLLMPAYVSLALLPQSWLENKSHYPAIDIWTRDYGLDFRNQIISVLQNLKNFNLAQRISVMELSLQNSHDEVLTSSASEYDLIWKKGCCRYN